MGDSNLLISKNLNWRKKLIPRSRRLFLLIPLMVDIIKDTKEAKPNYEEQMKAFFPKTEEGLVDFLNRCKLKDSEVMLCPCCNVIFDK